MNPSAVRVSVASFILFLLLLALLYRSIDGAPMVLLDRTVQSAVHSHATPALTLLAKGLSALGSPRTVWLLTIILSTIQWLRRPRRPAYLLALTMAAAGILENVIKLLARRPRPPLPWAYVHEHTFSFPSGHATLAVALYGIFVWIAFRTPHPAWQRATALIAAFTLISAISLSRVYLGAHYPTDVLAGFFTGAATLTLIVAADLAL